MSEVVSPLVEGRTEVENNDAGTGSMNRNKKMEDKCSLFE